MFRQNNNLPIYTPYIITVKANNAKGDSSALLTPVIGYTGEDMPLATPTDLSYDPDTLRSTQVDLTWTQVDMSPSVIRGFFRGYRIQVGELPKYTCFAMFSVVASTEFDLRGGVSRNIHKFCQINE